MPVLLIAFGIALGAVAAYLITRSHALAAQEQLVALRGQNEQIVGERDRAQAEVTQLHGRLTADQREAHDELTRVRCELAEANTAVATAQAALEAQAEAHDERLRELREFEGRIDERVKAATAGALQATTPQLVQLAKAQLGKERAEGKAEIEADHKRVEKLFGSVDKTLTQVAGKLTEIEVERTANREQLSAQLATMRESQTELMAGTQALVGALGRPHVRGRWGEIQLRNIVETAGMLPHVDFDEQVSFPGEEGVLRPDACVHMPGGRDVVIDSKVPLAAYLEWLSETDPEKQKLLLTQHARHVRTHLSSLDSKAYWQRLEGSPDFVVMFIPNDQVLLAAMEADRTLAEAIHRHKVVIATPMNLMALLRIMALGWRQETLTANAKEVEKLGRDLHKRLGTFATHLRGIGKKIGTLVKGYNDAVGSFERTVMPGARRFTELGAAAPDTSLDSLDEVTQVPRVLHQSEAELRALPSAPERVDGEQDEDHDDETGGAAISAA